MNCLEFLLFGTNQKGWKPRLAGSVKGRALAVRRVVLLVFVGGLRKLEVRSQEDFSSQGVENFLFGRHSEEERHLFVNHRPNLISK